MSGRVAYQVVGVVVVLEEKWKNFAAVQQDMQYRELNAWL